MTRFSDIPTEKFPLNFDKYRQLRDDIYAAADGFDDLGTADGYAVSRELIQVQIHLGRAWELIRSIEHRKSAR